MKTYIGLQYHIKNCLGCCEGYQSKESYRKMIDEIKEIAKAIGWDGGKTEKDSDINN